MNLVLIGSSTGGLDALSSFFSSDLENKMVSPIFISQHIPKFFIPNFASQLSRMTKKEIVIVEKLISIEESKIYIPCGSHHLVLSKNCGSVDVKLALPTDLYTPSVNTLFESAIESNCNYFLNFIVLSGMGSDGTKALEKLNKTSKHYKLICQDAESSSVYGMPKSASALVLPSISINPKIMINEIIKR